MSWIGRVRRCWARIGPRTVDVALIVVSLLSTVVEVLARDPGPHRWQVSAVVTILGSLSLWWRRSHPVLVTSVGILLQLWPALPFVLVVGLFSLAVRRRDLVLVLMTLAGATALALHARNGTPGVPRDAIALGLIEAGFCAAAGAYIGARRDLLATLRERADRAEAEREFRADQARVGERSRIAGEMHDVLAHRVSLIALHAGALEVNPGVGPARVAETAALIRGTAREAMEDLREVLGVLRAGTETGDADLAPPPRADDIARLVEASKAAGIRADIDMRIVAFPDAVARTAYRVVQEGLTNVHKHARGAATTVLLDGNERSGVRVEVVNRRPVSVDLLLPGSGLGHIGLRERIALLGGTLESGPTPEGGWRLAAWMPWHTSAPSGASGLAAPTFPRTTA